MMSGFSERMLSWGRRGAILCGALALSACVTLYRDHGYVPSEDQLAALRPGVDTRETVAEAVGKPVPRAC